MAEELWKLSACELADGIRQQRYRCLDVMASVVARMRDLNPALNAIVYDDTAEALREAVRADEDLARGIVRGPLHGIPVTIKENVDQAGAPTPNGVAAFAGVVAPDDAPVVRHLRRAGAILIGRTNTPEFSMRPTTDNPLHGRTYNPWDPEASPGGSSGGAGAAAAAGFGPIHHGNDIGGSLRFPAFSCGVATVKPSLGRVAAFNPSAAAERGALAQLMSVQGALCREVRDVRLALEVMAQRDVRDPWWSPAPFHGEPLPAPTRVAVTKNGHGYPMHPDIARAIDRAAGWLAKAGYAVDEIEPPPVIEAARAWFAMAVGEMKVMLIPTAQQHGSEAIQQVFEWFERMAKPVDPAGYMLGFADRSRLVRQWHVFLEEYPLVLTPFMMRPTYSWNYDLEGYEQMKDIFDASIYSYSMNFLGLPAGVVPVGLVEGLPAGVQIVGRRFREDAILDAMEAIEASAGVLTRTLWDRNTG